MMDSWRSMEIKRFFEIANSAHNLLKFTFEISETSLQFLDTMVHKGPIFQSESVLDISIYTKPTDNFQYLHRKSTHPDFCYKSFLIGEGYIILRNTSD